MKSSARAWTSVILAGKRVSHRHSTTNFSENVVVAETSYKVLEVLSFCCQGMASSGLIKITMVYSWRNGRTMRLSRGVYYLRSRRKMYTMSILQACCESTVSLSLLRAWPTCYKGTIALYDRHISTLSENNKRKNFVYAALKCIVCLMRI